MNDRFARLQAKLGAPPQSRRLGVRVEFVLLRLLALAAALFGLAMTLFGRYAYVIAKPEDDTSRRLSIACALVGLVVVGAGVGIFRLRVWAAVLWSVITAATALLCVLAIGSDDVLTTFLWAVFGCALVATVLVKRAALRAASPGSIKAGSVA